MGIWILDVPPLAEGSLVTSLPESTGALEIIRREPVDLEGSKRLIVKIHPVLKVFCTRRTSSVVILGVENSTRWSHNYLRLGPSKVQETYELNGVPASPVVCEFFFKMFLSGDSRDRIALETFSCSSIFLRSSILCSISYLFSCALASSGNLLNQLMDLLSQVWYPKKALKQEEKFRSAYHVMGI